MSNEKSMCDVDEKQVELFNMSERIHADLNQLVDKLSTMTARVEQLGTQVAEHKQLVGALLAFDVTEGPMALIKDHKGLWHHASGTSVVPYSGCSIATFRLVDTKGHTTIADALL